MTKFKIKKGDKVVVLAGHDKGKSGEVLRVVRARQSRRRSGRQHDEAPYAAAAGRAGRHRRA